MGKCLCRAGRVLSYCRRQLLAEPQQDRHRRDLYGGLLRPTLFHPPHRPGGCDLCPGRLRRNQAAGRIADGNRRVSALPARGGLSDPDLERRRRGGAGGVVARSDCRDGGDHQNRERVTGHPAQAIPTRPGGRTGCRSGRSGAGAGTGDAAAIAETTGGATRPVDGADRSLAEKFELASLQLPQELPVSLPSNLVEQRPDIQSAEAQLHSASALIGVALAARLPQFTLTGNAGATANQISQLFMTPGTAFWTLAGNVAQTVFDAGTLLHKERAAVAAFEEAAAMYRSTVIAAFQNVADTLHALQSDADTLRAAFAAV